MSFGRTVNLELPYISVVTEELNLEKMSVMQYLIQEEEDILEMKMRISMHQCHLKN